MAVDAACAAPSEATIEAVGPNRRVWAAAKKQPRVAKLPEMIDDPGEQMPSKSLIFILRLNGQDDDFPSRCRTKTIPCDFAARRANEAGQFTRPDVFGP